jgi:hypothetical protein
VSSGQSGTSGTTGTSGQSSSTSQPSGKKHHARSSASSHGNRVYLTREQLEQIKQDVAQLRQEVGSGR